jgi:hypothetical protein
MKSPYPPHLSLIPDGPDNLNAFQIFENMRLLDTGFVLSQIIPDSVKDFVYSKPSEGASIKDVWTRNKQLRAGKKNILTEPNIGDRPDWYVDEVFAQQHFTGTNPTTIELAKDWVGRFQDAAKVQGKADVVKFLTSAEKSSLYVQDYSYFRASVGAAPDAILTVSGEKQGEDRWTTAAVALFNLQPNGKLHPLAIVVDYRGSMKDSVVIFNKRLDASVSGDQYEDWPWRYAKTCVQSADWLRHETTVHLNDAHFVEEATIVAAHRTLPADHLVYRALEPHWFRTLPLNANARSTLVPQVITKLVGMPADSMYAFVKDAYKRFNWTEHYVPTSLENRGFPLKELQTNKKYKNYTYGRNILLMWQCLRSFVTEYLANGGAGFTNNDKVNKDPYIKAWYQEMQSDNGGQMKSFPTIDTLDKLIDTVTMCIHIASPQHTAVNYLQDYYQAFVINKPPAMCTAPPTTIDQLLKYKEKDLILALPINRSQQWLLASHIPHLLSSRVPAEQNLVNYGVSLYNLSETKGEKGLQAAAKSLVFKLNELGDTTVGGKVTVEGVFTKFAKEMDDQVYPYNVMDPVATAASIMH